MSETEPTVRRGVQIARIFGVPVYVAPSWFLFAAFIVFVLGPPLVDRFGEVQAYATAASLALLLGLSVLLHEIGHCAVARAFDLPVRSITITLLAGFTEITTPPQTPPREYAVAAAGPMVSLLLASIGVAMIPLFAAGSLPRAAAEVLAVTNGVVAGFNLLPGLPLDGGRVLRSAIWRVTGDPDRATVVAAWAGRVLAIVVVPLVLLGLLPALGYGGQGVGSILFSALLSAFIYAGATAALRQSQVQSRIADVSVARLARPALRVRADLPLSEAVRLAQEAGVKGLVVTDSADRLSGVVSEAAVIATPQERRPWVQVGTLSRRLEDGLRLDPSLAGADLVAALRQLPASEYVVEDPVTGSISILATADVAAAVGN
ncbi:MAG TPA: site-2 protease family protein [Mycobacteriales bacterium]|nr:site-2 protease family protein [Mycobacteriales bacterium]